MNTLGKQHLGISQGGDIGPVKGDLNQGQHVYVLDHKWGGHDI